MNDWTPDSWRRREARQQPAYPDLAAVDEVVAQIARLPPLVTSWEVEALRTQLAEAAAGDRFLLHGGDCAEHFGDCTPEVVTNKLKILLQMSLVLVHGLRRRVIRVGRLAGQYAKPRSADLETRDGVSLPSYRGDLVNRPGFTPEERTPDPVNMLRGYTRSALTLNFVRALVDGGFADLHQPGNWDLEFMDLAPAAAEYRRVVAEIGRALDFMETVSGQPAGDSSRVDFFTSHEALLLPYEQAQTRTTPKRPGWYNLATHLPWLGARTVDPGGAHVEYLRGIRNPVGIKVGPDLEAEALLDLLERIDPEREPGRVTLIHRFGVAAIEARLPPLVEAVARTGRRPLWVSDPMHGNTRITRDGVKTRRFEEILGELEHAFRIHRDCGSRLGGVHFELTGDNVTECTGGARGLAEGDLHRDYRTLVDPRLNYEQALEMALLIARLDDPRA
ncbi:MAG: 3-deoxy-7-phosphoheptulonate synthase class II [Gammaproteobacteria bacterium]|nr:3-deoxy-7-phosphoheptulonate synthase class II [Gammaproteobacteria bacterium]